MTGPLSRALQSVNIDFGKALNLLDSALKQLKELREDPQKILGRVDDDFEGLEWEENRLCWKKRMPSELAVDEPAALLVPFGSPPPSLRGEHASPGRGQPMGHTAAFPTGAWNVFPPSSSIPSRLVQGVNPTAHSLSPRRWTCSAADASQRPTVCTPLEGHPEFARSTSLRTEQS